MPEKANKFISLIIWSLALRSINHEFYHENAIELLAEKRITFTDYIFIK